MNQRIEKKQQQPYTIFCGMGNCMKTVNSDLSMSSHSSDRQSDFIDSIELTLAATDFHIFSLKVESSRITHNQSISDTWYNSTIAV